MRILIAEDDTITRTLLKGTLERSGHEVIAVADGKAAIDELLRVDAPRLAILDWMMPGADGPEVCRTIRELSENYVYLILLTAKDGAADIVQGLESGADDFVRKPFDASELKARLRSGIRVLDLQARLLDAHDALRQHATLDHLTGLWNRRMILEQLDRELNRVRREHRDLTIAIVDLDCFKGINDTYGHAVGDTVLCTTASVIRSQLREYDFIGRYGGEEFVVLLPGCDEVQGHRIAERIRAAVAAAPVRHEQAIVQVTASLGVASSGSGIAAAVDLIEAADAALYAAKANGRNRVEVAGKKVCYA